MFEGLEAVKGKKANLHTLMLRMCWTSREVECFFPVEYLTFAISTCRAYLTRARAARSPAIVDLFGAARLINLQRNIDLDVS